MALAGSFLFISAFFHLDINFLSLFFQKSEEYSVAVAVRLHKTLELAGDKFYMITCGKAGFQNSRYVNFWIEVVGKQKSSFVWDWQCSF